MIVPQARDVYFHCGNASKPQQNLLPLSTAVLAVVMRCCGGKKTLKNYFFVLIKGGCTLSERLIGPNINEEVPAACVNNSAMVGISVNLIG